MGNRINRTKPNGDYAVYAWDAVNRMVQFFDEPRTTWTNYEYRPDRLRTHKAQDKPNQPTLHESARYDGQMPFEQARYVEGGDVTVTRSGLGARGIDVEEVKTGSYSSGVFTLSANWSAPSYPLYDAHGNRICALTRSGTSYTTDSPRTYDVWGSVRTGAPRDGSTSRYCANLGHVQDDESGLVYMRARYYEPGHGRFISEDPAREGANWVTYCGNDPVNYNDKDGNNRHYAVYLAITGAMMLLIGMMLLCGSILVSIKLDRLLEALELLKVPGSNYPRPNVAELEDKVRSLEKAKRGLRTGALATAIAGMGLIWRAYLMDAEAASQGEDGPVELLFGG